MGINQIYLASQSDLQPASAAQSLESTRFATRRGKDEKVSYSHPPFPKGGQGGLFCFLLFISLSFSPSAFPQNLKIGVALPLFEESGDNALKLLGQDVLAGIKFSLEQYNINAKQKVAVEVRDTKKDPSVNLSIIKEFADNENIIAMLGPVYSGEVAAIASAAEILKIPVISPTATGDELAETHSYVFQLNPSYRIRGKVMADYLIKELGFKNFVVIAEDSYGTNFSKAFESEVARLKGRIVLSDSYDKRSADISSIASDILNVIKENDFFINLSNLNVNQIHKLETIGLTSSLKDSLIKSKTDVSIFKLFGKEAKGLLDSAGIKYYKLKPEAEKFSQGYIDAIYIPISNPDEIGLIAPVLDSNGLNFFIAGTGDWNNQKALNDNKSFLKKIIFESEYFPDENELNTLKSEYKDGSKVNKFFLFGFDAMSVILDLISDGKTSREQLNDALNKLSGYNAVKSKVSLDYKRVNSELNILTFDGTIRKVTDYRISK